MDRKGSWVRLCYLSKGFKKQHNGMISTCKSINQSTNQSIDQSIDPSISDSVREAFSQSLSQSVRQSVSQSNSHPVSQHWTAYKFISLCINDSRNPEALSHHNSQLLTIIGRVGRLQESGSSLRTSSTFQGTVVASLATELESLLFAG